MARGTRPGALAELRAERVLRTPYRIGRHVRASGYFGSALLAWRAYLYSHEFVRVS